MRDRVRISFLLLAIFSAGVLISVSYRFSHEWVIVDRCLSDKHGSFDYSRMSCDLETNHPYIAYSVRNPHDKQIAVLSFLSFTMFVSGWFYRRTNAGELSTAD